MGLEQALTTKIRSNQSFLTKQKKDVIRFMFLKGNEIGYLLPERPGRR